MSSALPYGFIGFTRKGGRRTKPEGELQKAWVSSPSLAGGAASAQALVQLWPHGGPAPLLPPWCWGASGSQAAATATGPPSSTELGWPRGALVPAHRACGSGPVQPAEAEGPSLPLVFPHDCSFEFRASGRDIQAPSRLHMLSLDSRISPDLTICPLLACILHKVYIHFHQHL